MITNLEFLYGDEGERESERGGQKWSQNIMGENLAEESERDRGSWLSHHMREGDSLGDGLGASVSSPSSSSSSKPPSEAENDR